VRSNQRVEPTGMSFLANRERRRAGGSRARRWASLATRHQPLQEQESAMTVHLDHLMVPSRNKMASAKLLAELLGVPWSETGVGPFAPVYVNDGLTIDFDEWTDPIPMIHYCFRVDQDDFNVILERIRAAGIPYVATFMGRSTSELTRSTAAASSTGTNQMVINGKC